MILNIYKPKGISSFKMVSQVRRNLGVKKVGHAGTLDPLAQGVLIILTERDTKRQSEFMHQDKEYLAEIAFNLYSPCYDLEMLPEFVESPLNLSSLQKALPQIIPQFTGEIFQQVPAFSAVKHQGQPLYKKARKGRLDTDKLPSKLITIKHIDILCCKSVFLESIQGMQEVPVVLLRITCSSGTYIRSLARDLGEKLGTSAVLTGLTRSRVGDFVMEESKRIEDILKSEN